jgi:dynein heavy chain, axonemal
MVLPCLHPQSLSFPCLKPLMGWVDELLARLAFFMNWVKEAEHPRSFWLNAFTFPQAFLTATLQNFARRHRVAIDVLSFATNVLGTPSLAQVEEGCVVTGLFLEGAIWDR